MMTRTAFFCATLLAAAAALRVAPLPGARLAALPPAQRRLAAAAMQSLEDEVAAPAGGGGGGEGAKQRRANDASLGAAAVVGLGSVAAGIADLEVGLAIGAVAGAVAASDTGVIGGTLRVVGNLTAAAIYEACDLVRWSCAVVLCAGLVC